MTKWAYLEQGSAGPLTVKPRLVRIVTTDSLSTATAAGWWNNNPIGPNSGLTLIASDLVELVYNANSASQKTVVCNVAISASNVVTLSLAEGGVILPVTSGHFANFSGTSGAIADLGFLPSNAALTNVVMQSAASVSGNIPKYNDVNGTLVDSGLAESNIVAKNASNTMAAGSAIIMAKVNGTESANAVTANGVAGVITTSSLTTAGGSSYAITWTNSQITSTSVVLVTIAGGTNTTENITLKCVPGSSSATLTIYNNTAATALNGTILLSYLVM